MKTRVTNRLGLPGPIVKAVTNDPYDAGDSDFTITGLNKPSRMNQLSKTAEVTEDAADRIYSLQGQVMHSILQRAGEELIAEGYIVEKRFKSTFVVANNIYLVSAQIDLFDPAHAVLSDYKYTSVGSAKRGLKEEHYWQLNVQAELLRRAGFQVDHAEVVLLLRDWSAERDYPGYPKEPTLKQTVSLVSSEEVTKWVCSRIQSHLAAQTSLPECTEEERWSRPTFAVMKDANASRAIRVFDSLKEAEEHITAKALQAIIVKRPGQSIRCMRYCPVRSVCEQGKKLQALANVDEDGFTRIK